MRAITWTELNGTWYGVLSRAGQVIPPGKPHYGKIIFTLPKTNSNDLDEQYKIEFSLEGSAYRYARTVEHGIIQCESLFRDWLADRGLLAQIDLDYERVFSEVRGYWRDLGAIAEALGVGITYDRILSALKLLIADGLVEVKEGGDGLAPTYRATLK